MNRVFNDYGIFHFVSQSFDPAAGKSSVNDGGAQRSVDDLLKRISTVIIDEDESDSFTIRVDAKGFHPNNVAVRKVCTGRTRHVERLLSLHSGEGCINT